MSRRRSTRGAWDPSDRTAPPTQQELAAFRRAMAELRGRSHKQPEPTEHREPSDPTENDE